MRGYVVHICCFSALDDLPRKAHRDPDKVLAALHKAGRFSVFEATANIDIANTMTDLFASGRVVDIGGAYPWTKVRVPELEATEPIAAGTGTEG